MRFNSKKELNNKIMHIMSQAGVTGYTYNKDAIIVPFDQTFINFVEIVYNHKNVISNPIKGQYMIVKPIIKLTDKKTLLTVNNMKSYIEYCQSLMYFMTLFKNNCEVGGDCLLEI